ncbi:MAG TPA: trehalose-phosphatase, partial [Candidatus Binatia bacterium]|nr:trehalose-phosphatase [Candidatus Binatia bacterium]
MSERTFAETSRRLEDLANAAVLLIASDYDGTLAPLVSDFANARPDRECIVALRTLAALPHTHVAVISGRSLRDLARLSDLPAEVHLVGSHGSEFDADFQGALDEQQRSLRSRVHECLEQIAARGEHLRIEEKPASFALHFRDASEETGRRALEQVEHGPVRWPGVFTRHGKFVVELSVLPTSKGRALATIRQRVGATAVIFIGDDVTDEEAFATLSGPDVGVKVGPGETLARYGIDEISEVAQLLCRLAELRTDWAHGAGAVPIDRHAFLSDQRGFGLVTGDARMTWLCLPRLDSPPLFAELLGGPAAGRFTIAPTNGNALQSQSYMEGSLVLRTQWDGITVSDFLDCSRDRPRQSAGRSDLLRIVEGKGRVRIEFAPRLDFGRIPTRLRRHALGVVVEGSFDPIVLRAPDVHWEIVEEGRHQTALAEVELDGEPLVLDLRYGTGSMSEPKILSVGRRDLTCQYWSSWASRLELPQVEPETVLRSALTLRALCYGPSGAIAAAATTSLPEHVGGVRNWDYRYCWLRDATFTLYALLIGGYREEAVAWRDWLLRAVAG